MKAFKWHCYVVRARRVQNGRPPRCRYVAKMSATTIGYAESCSHELHEPTQFGHMPSGFSFCPRFKRYLTRFYVPLHPEPHGPQTRVVCTMGSFLRWGHTRPES